MILHQFLDEKLGDNELRTGSLMRMAQTTGHREGVRLDMGFLGIFTSGRGGRAAVVSGKGKKERAEFGRQGGRRQCESVKKGP